jgi:replicative DNA helicase
VAADAAPDAMVPHSIEAERSVLGSILIDNQIMNRVVPIVRSGDFYRESHRRIFQAMETMALDSRAIDLVTLRDTLENSGQIENVGGAQYIASLVDGVPKSVNAEHHARIVKEKAVLRKLMDETARINAMASRSQEPADVILDEAEKIIFRLAEDRFREGFVPIQQAVQEANELVQRLKERQQMITGVPTGFVDLDSMTTGFQAGDLVVLAARPSMGKTALALNIAANAALRHDATVGFFSLEMTREQLLLRMLSSEARVDGQRLRTGHVREDEYRKVVMASESLRDAKMFIDDSPGLEVLEMRAKARRLKADKGLDILIVDYLQLMTGRSRMESRQLEIAEISRSLKGLAKELKIPVIALSQLSRAPEARSEDGHRPKLSDLRESGAIEQDADIVLFIFREEVYKRDEEFKGQAEIIIGKQRNGPTGTVKAVFLKDYSRFENRAVEF